MIDSLAGSPARLCVTAGPLASSSWAPGRLQETRGGRRPWPRGPRCWSSGGSAARLEAWLGGWSSRPPGEGITSIPAPPRAALRLRVAVQSDPPGSAVGCIFKRFGASWLRFSSFALRPFALAHPALDPVSPKSCLTRGAGSFLETLA